MSENSITGTGAPPEAAAQITEEIRAALRELKKHGYSAVYSAPPEADGDLSISFALGEVQQVLKLNSSDWHKPGAVQAVIIDKLEI